MASIQGTPTTSASQASTQAGVNPTLQQWIDNIEKWETEHANDTPSTNGFAEEIAQFISQYAAQNPNATPSQVLNAIQQKFFSGEDGAGGDVYFRSNATSPEQLQNFINSVFTGGAGNITLPPVTDMDKLLMSYRLALADTKTSKADEAILVEFIKKIGELGSDGKISSLQSWMKDVMNNPANPDHTYFTDASSDVQKLLEAYSVNYKG